MTTLELADQIGEERAAVVSLARDFARREIAPYAGEWDRTKDHPREVMTKLGELGFLGMRVPQQYDGLGLDALTYLMVLEEIAAADASIAISLGVHNSLTCGMLLEYGSEEQKERWLKPLARGQMLGAFAMSEPESGSDAAGLQTQAVRVGGKFVLNGTKGWVTNGDRADLFIVLARTDTPGQRRGSRGISAFIVPAETPGVEPGKAEDKMGLRASRTTQLILRDVELGPEHLLGEENRGLHYALHALDRGRLGVAAQALGIARAALEHAVAYAAERRQFDRPIKDFQAIQFKLADMATRVAATRALVHEVARKLDRGVMRSADASMAKLFASETAMWVATQAVQIFGGYGYMREYPVERLFRDAKVTEIYEGTSEVQRIVIARGLYT